MLFKKKDSLALNKIPVTLFTKEAIELCETRVLELSQRLFVHVVHYKVNNIIFEGQIYKSLWEVLNHRGPAALRDEEINAYYSRVALIHCASLQRVSQSEVPNRVYERVELADNYLVYVFNEGLLSLSKKMIIGISRDETGFFISGVCLLRSNEPATLDNIHSSLTFLTPHENRAHRELLEEALSKKEFRKESLFFKLIQKEIVIYNRLLEHQVIRYGTEGSVKGSWLAKYGRLPQIYYPFIAGEFFERMERAKELNTDRNKEVDILYADHAYSFKAIGPAPNSFLYQEPSLTLERYAEQRNIASDQVILVLRMIGNSDSMAVLDSSTQKLLDLLLKERAAVHKEKTPIQDIAAIGNNRPEELEVKIGSIEHLLRETIPVLRNIDTMMGNVATKTDIMELKTELVKQLQLHVQTLRSEYLESVSDNQSNKEDLQSALESYMNRLLQITIDRVEAEGLNQSTTFEGHEKSLKSCFGSAWAKLDEQTITLLLTSEVVFHHTKHYQGSLDFSSSIIPLTKALERELYLNLYSPLLEECVTRYGRRYSIWPSSLVRKAPSGQFERKEMTLGSIPFALKDSRALTILEAMKLFKNPDFLRKESIHVFISQLEAIKEIRNHAAHKEGITIDTAEKCRQIMLFEKLLFIHFMAALK